jgi:hypothetical protein
LVPQHALERGQCVRQSPAVRDPGLCHARLAASAPARDRGQLAHCFVGANAA